MNIYFSKPCSEIHTMFDCNTSFLQN